MRFPLRTKLFALSALVVTVIMTTVTLVFTVRQQVDKREATERAAARVAENIATLQLLENQDWSIYQEYISHLMATNRDIVYIAVYDERNALRAHTLNADLVAVDDEGELAGRARADLVRRLDRGEVAEESRADLRTQRVNILDGDRVLGRVHVGFSLIDVNQDLRRGVVRNVELGLAFVVLFGAISFLLSRRLTRPIERLSQAMGAIAGGDLEQRVRPETHDEIGQLARSFNDMVVDLRERQIIDRLGQDLRGTFQLDRLAGLVRERLALAAGAESARLYLRQPDRAHTLAELTAAGGRAAGAIVLDAAAAELERPRPETFPLGEAPASLRTALAASSIRAEDLCVPLLVKSELVGLLVLGRPRGAPPFADKSRRLAATLAGQAALALENALLYEQLREQERMRGELEVARSVQRRLLPREAPQVEGFLIDAMCRPAHEVGGDYYDFLRLDEQTLGLVIADVSGKGTSASLYMAEIKGMMLSLATTDRSPRRVLIELNRRLYPSLDRHVFASVLYAILDTRRASLEYARAGHSPLLLRRASGEVESVASGGIAVGLDPGPTFDKQLEERTVELAPGDAAVLFTDGVTDAMKGGEPFGARRLRQAVAGCRAHGARELGQAIVAAVDGFAAGAPPFDDLTVLVVRRAAAADPQ